MKTDLKYCNDYVYAAMFFAILSIFGSLLSFINFIPLLITYELLKKAHTYSQPQQIKITNTIFQVALFLTFIVSLFYITIQI